MSANIRYTDLSVCNAHSAFTISTEPLGNLATLAIHWRDLEARADCSFFQSWEWLGTLAANVSRTVPVDVLHVRRGTEVVGLCLLVPARRTRHRFVRANELHVNETGRPEYDCLTIEYNGILTDRRVAREVTEAALAWLVNVRDDWDELHLAGLGADAANAYRRAGEAIGLKALLRDRKRADAVDLAAIRAASGGYVESLSRNSRHQIRRSIRLYEEEGPLLLTSAGSINEALEFLDRLKALHQAYWQARGKPGAFANPFFETFHRDLICRCFNAGRIQIVCISAGTRAIGYIYNLVAGSTVYQYQSGFRYDADPKLKPGLVSHYLAILHSLERGTDVYDFLAGESQHKKTLGTTTTELDWVVLQRDRLKYRIENRLRDAKHWLRAGNETSRA